MNIELQSPRVRNLLRFRLQLGHVPVNADVPALQEARFLADEPDEEVRW